MTRAQPGNSLIAVVGLGLAEQTEEQFLMMTTGSTLTTNGKANGMLLTQLHRIRHVALDMDGTIYSGGTLFETTTPFLALLQQLNIGYTFLTNNPSKNISDSGPLGKHGHRRALRTTVHLDPGDN
jgi:ribonucleotide monophosphatase NagD (HAD superfamily)